MNEQMEELAKAIREFRRAAVRECVLQFLAGVWVGIVIMLIVWVATQGWPT